MRQTELKINTQFSEKHAPNQLIFLFSLFVAASHRNNFYFSQNYRCCSIEASCIRQLSFWLFEIVRIGKSTESCRNGGHGEVLPTHGQHYSAVAWHFDIGLNWDAKPLTTHTNAQFAFIFDSHRFAKSSNHWNHESSLRWRIQTWEHCVLFQVESGTMVNCE